MLTKEREEWRRLFTDTITNLAGGEAGLQVANWAIVAQQLQGDLDPKVLNSVEI